MIRLGLAITMGGLMAPLMAAGGHGGDSPHLGPLREIKGSLEIDEFLILIYDPFFPAVICCDTILSRVCLNTNNCSTF